jgi:hypothetical protein
MSVGEVATRDYLRSELRTLLADLEEREADREAEREASRAVDADLERHARRGEPHAADGEDAPAPT